MRTAFAFCDRNQLQTARLLGISRNVVRARLMGGRDRRRYAASPRCRPRRTKAPGPPGRQPGAPGPHPIVLAQPPSAGAAGAAAVRQGCCPGSIHDGRAFAQRPRAGATVALDGSACPSRSSRRALRKASRAHSPGRNVLGNTADERIADAVDTVATALAANAVERDRRGGTAKRERDLIRAAVCSRLSIPAASRRLGGVWAETLQAVRRLARVDGSLAHLFGFHHLLLATVRLFGTPSSGARPMPTPSPTLVLGKRAQPARHAHDHRARGPSGYVVDGTKSFCSGARDSDRLIISALDPSSRLVVAASRPRARNRHPRRLGQHGPASDRQRLGQLPSRARCRRRDPAHAGAARQRLRVAAAVPRAADPGQRLPRPRRGRARGGARVHPRIGPRLASVGRRDAGRRSVRAPALRRALGRRSRARARWPTPRAPRSTAPGRAATRSRPKSAAPAPWPSPPPRSRRRARGWTSRRASSRSRARAPRPRGTGSIASGATCARTRCTTRSTTSCASSANGRWASVFRRPASIREETHEPVTASKTPSPPFARGEMVVVVDDAGRENEGDLIMAAEKATPAAIAFMVRHTSGVVCAALTAARLADAAAAADGGRQRRVAGHRVHRHRRLPPSAPAPGSRRPIARPRCGRWPIRRAAADDFVRPGHIFPLRARPGGVLERRGHTEAAVDLARAGGAAALRRAVRARQRRRHHGAPAVAARRSRRATGCPWSASPTWWPTAAAPSRCRRRSPRRGCPRATASSRRASIAITPAPSTWRWSWARCAAPRTSWCASTRSA